MQQINIFPGNPAAKDKLPTLAPCVNIVFIPGVTEDGKSVVLVSGFDPEGKSQELLFTAKNFAEIGGAVRGMMVGTGEIPVKVNPGIVMGVAKKDCGLVNFVAEVPLQSWDFTAEEALKWSKLLYQFAQAAGAVEPKAN